MTKSHSVEYIVQKRSMWGRWKDLGGYNVEDADRARDVFRACQKDNPGEYRFIWRTITDSDENSFIIVREGEMVNR